MQALPWPSPHLRAALPRLISRSASAQGSFSARVPQRPSEPPCGRFPQARAPAAPAALPSAGAGPARSGADDFTCMQTISRGAQTISRGAGGAAKNSAPKDSKTLILSCKIGPRPPRTTKRRPSPRSGHPAGARAPDPAMSCRRGSAAPRGGAPAPLSSETSRENGRRGPGPRREEAECLEGAGSLGEFEGREAVVLARHHRRPSVAAPYPRRLRRMRGAAPQTPPRAFGLCISCEPLLTRMLRLGCSASRAGSPRAKRPPNHRPRAIFITL